MHREAKALSKALSSHQGFQLPPACLQAASSEIRSIHRNLTTTKKTRIDGKNGFPTYRSSFVHTWDSPPPVNSTIGSTRRVASLATKSLTLLNTNTSSLEAPSGAMSLSRLAAISNVVQVSQDTPPLTSSPTTSSELVAPAASCSSSQVPGAKRERGRTGERVDLGPHEVDFTCAMLHASHVL